MAAAGRNSSRWHQFHRNHVRHNQRIIVINRNNNFSKSDTDQMHLNRQRQMFPMPQQQEREKPPEKKEVKEEND